jgi:plasmid stabilization system protein ParE
VNYVLNSDAEIDLDAIWEYVARDNIDAADRLIQSLFDAFEALARLSGLGHKGEHVTLFPFDSGQLVHT